MTFMADTLFFESQYVTAAARDAPPLAPLQSIWLAQPPLYGTFDDEQPLSISGLSVAGYAQSGVNSMLYGRIYITPSNFSLGAISNAQVRTFRVWNARFDEATLSSIIEQDADGLTLTAPFAIPGVFAPLLEADFSLTVDVEGPASIDATYTFQFGVESPVIRITGSRVTLFGFEPNWANSVEEPLEWATDVIQMYDGTEQRIQMRARPRRRLEYSVLLKNEKAQYFDSVMWGWQSRIFAVPLWQYVAATSAPVSAGATSVSVSTTDVPFISGELAVLYVDPGSYEVVDILAVGPSTLTLSRPTGAAWPAGTKIYPVSLSHLEGNVPVRRLTDRALSAQVRFLSLPAASDPYVPVAAAPVTYNGYEVLTQQPDWAGGVDIDFEFQKDVIDYNIGDIELAATTLNQSQYWRYRWLLKTRAEIRQFREFLRRRAGQLKPLYIPSWNSDLTVTQPISAGATSLVCADRMFYLMVGLDPPRAHMMIRTRNNGDFYRPITAISQTGGEVTIGFGVSPLGVSLAPGDIKAVHLMSLYRLASDSVTLSWRTSRVATVEATMKLVRA